MAQIIDIHDDIVVIGIENGKIKQVLKEECRFIPHIGDEVNIYEDDEQDLVYVVKKGMQQTGHTYEYNRQEYNNNDHYKENNTFYYPVNRSCNRIVYLVACALFGMFGAHWFVAKNTKRGILYLIFFWTMIPLFMAMGDFMKGCVIPADSNGNINPAAPLHHQKVDKVLYLIITFFFGAFGFQKYYSGENTKGNLCLAFFWTGIPEIIAIIDFISALLKPADRYGLIDQH